MGQCFIWLILLALGVLAMVTLLKWFDQATEAVDDSQPPMKPGG